MRPNTHFSCNPIVTDSLLQNGIEALHSRTPLPGHLGDQVRLMRAERASPGPTTEHIKYALDELDNLADSYNEAQVEAFFAISVFS